MPGSQWKRIARVGTPKVKPTSSKNNPSEIKIDFKTKPGHKEDWENLFKKRARELGIHPYFDSFTTDTADGSIHADEDELEQVVALLDEAIEYANDQYERAVLPARHAEADQKVKDAEIAQQRQVNLDERATKLAKPDP
jgi:hypothetical protein